MITVFRKRDELDLWGYRVTSPPETEEGWEEVRVEDLKASERIALRIDRIAEKQGKKDSSFEDRMRAFEVEIDRMSAQLLARGSDTETVAGKPEIISICRLARAITSKDWTGADLERHAVTCDASKALRALGSQTDAAGGYMVPEAYLGEQFIELLRANTIAEALGVTRLTGLTASPVVIPKQAGGATHYWVGENSSITESTQATEQLRLIPHKSAAFTKVSNELILLANPGAEQFVRNDLAKVLGLGLDLAIIKGSGNQQQPLGVMNTTGITTFTATGFTSGTSKLTFDYGWDMLYQLEAANAAQGNLAFAMHPRNWNQARKSADSASQPKMDPGAGAPIARTIDGMPIQTTTQFAAGEVVLGNWSECIVAEWAGINFLASNVAGDAMQNDQTFIRAIQLVDVGLRHGASFVASTGFSATG